MNSDILTELFINLKKTPMKYMKTKILTAFILMLALQGISQSPARQSGDHKAFCRDLNKVIKDYPYPSFKKYRGDKITDSKAFAGDNDNRHLSKLQVSGAVESAIQYDKRWHNGWVFGMSLLHEGTHEEGIEIFDRYSGYILQCKLPVALKAEEVKERGINKTLYFRPSSLEKGYENLIIKLINVGFVSSNIRLHIYSEE
jgi:hypothetical protein